MALLKSQEKRAARRDDGGGRMARRERNAIGMRGGGEGGNLVPERSFTYVCARARACENELPGEVIHCSAETNACARAHACVYDAALSSEIRSARSAKRTIVT